MEKYLKEDYNVIEDLEDLTCEDDIKEYFGDLAYDYLDCGQGYYTDEYNWICKIGEDFYNVYVSAEIMSAKQDVGDRLYWVDRITNIKYEKIDKPLPKDRTVYKFSFEITKEKYKDLISFLKENKINYHEFF